MAEKITIEHIKAQAASSAEHIAALKARHDDLMAQADDAYREHARAAEAHASFVGRTIVAAEKGGKVIAAGPSEHGHLRVKVDCGVDEKGVAQHHHYEVSGTYVEEGADVEAGDLLGWR